MDGPTLTAASCWLRSGAM